MICYAMFVVDCACLYLVSYEFCWVHETREYSYFMNICYTRQSLELHTRVPNGWAWVVARVVT